MATPKKEYVNSYAKPMNLGREANLMWEHVMGNYELNRTDCRLVVDICREIDLINRLENEWHTAATLVKGSQGQPVGNPIIADLARHRSVLQAQIKQLGLEKRKMVGKTTPQEANKSNVVAQMDKWRKGGLAAQRLDTSPPSPEAMRV